jgi:hypothetical protein
MPVDQADATLLGAVFVKGFRGASGTFLGFWELLAHSRILARIKE